MLAVARTGVPSGLNNVNLALTDLRKPLNRASGWLSPQWNCSNIGSDCPLWRESLVGVIHLSRVSMSCTRLPLPSQSSKKISIETVRGFGPGYSGLAGVLDALVVGRAPSAD